ncbi:MAG: prenyltransferase [Actinobacteria bacterium]|nr:prenyltransferase [Actinomycetota bacterium]
MKKYLELSRAPFFTAIITPALLAAALAFRDTGTLDWTRFTLVMAGLVAAHAAANLFNDYFDYRLGADTIEVRRTPFSGGSPHLVEGREREGTFLAMALGSLAVCAGCGVAVMFLLGRSFPPVLGIGAAGVLIGVFYTAPPLKLAYRGLGEAAIFLAFGVLPVLGVFYVLAERFTLNAFLASLPPAFLITDIILINEFPDLQTDREAGKLTLVARLGSGFSRYVYIIMVVAAYALVVAFSLLEVYGGWGFLGLAGLPFSLPASAILWREHDRADKLVPAQAMTILAHLATGLALAVGIWISA